MGCKMSEDLKNIMLSGFTIFPSNGKFVLKKQSVPESNFSIDNKEFNSYEDAMEFAIKMLKEPRIFNWSAIIRYNRGLGIEYKNLQLLQAESYDIAYELAQKQVDALFFRKKVVVSEIKVRKEI
jgi:hypothetical protein